MDRHYAKDLFCPTDDNCNKLPGFLKKKSLLPDSTINLKEKNIATSHFFAYCGRLLWAGEKPRSVYSLRDEIDPHKWADSDKLACEMDILAKALRVENATEVSEFSEPYFDGLRKNLFDKLPKTPDFIRSLYSGKFNVFIIMVGMGVFRWMKANSLDFLACNASQAPSGFKPLWKPWWRSERTDFVQNTEDVESILNDEPDIAWNEIWKDTCLSNLLPRLNTHKNGPQPLTVASSQFKGTLDELELQRSVWSAYANNIERQSLFDSICSQQAEAAYEKRLDFSLTRTSSSEAWPEKMIEFGFIGTVIGLMLAMASLAMTQVPSEDPLYHSAAVGELAINLRLCFSTTFWGLIFAIYLRTAANRWKNQEDCQVRLLTQAIDQFFRHNKDRVKFSPELIE